MLWSCGSLAPIPETASYHLEIPKVNKVNDSTFTFKQNFLIKNKQSLWEMYNSGNALQLGYNAGALSQSLMHQQEDVFFSKVKEFVPSKFRQNLLKTVLKWYARKMHRHVREDFQTELYGVSRYSSDDYDFIAPKFQRSLYLHAAHDIGHAMQDLMLVGCSSFAVWNEKSEDGNLLLGRAFDFYVGDDFAKQKPVNFIVPEQGIPFMSVSWPGMIGVASGMNKEGISVTINAGKSKIPLSAKTPISLVTREILQFAKTIDEAVAIARKREVFVSESIMVGSAKDRKAVIIDVSPKNFGVYEMPNSNSIICTNHFQSESFKTDSRNLKQKQESHSVYRYEKISEFISENQKLNPEKMAKLLRDRSGIKNQNLGNGNEKAINQLLAHHAVIFSPEKLQVWVSSAPYQLGEFVCYDLNKIFSEQPKPSVLESKNLNIERDSFADSQEFKNYEKYRVLDRKMDEAIKNKLTLSENWLNDYKALNPELWIVHYKSGKYHYENREYEWAKKDFEMALSKEISSLPERKIIGNYLRKTLRKIKP